MIGEVQIIQGIQAAFNSPAGIAFCAFCARWMIFLLTLPAAATSYKRRHKALRAAAYEAAWSGLVALILSLSLAAIIGRLRPFIASPDVNLLIPAPASFFSFPSSHASVAFAVAFALLYGDVTIGLVALLMACLVAFGRVATGVHYPSDAIAGALLGFISFLVTSNLLRRLPRNRRNRYAKLKDDPVDSLPHETSS